MKDRHFSQKQGSIKFQHFAQVTYLVSTRWPHSKGACSSLSTESGRKWCLQRLKASRCPSRCQCEWGSFYISFSVVTNCNHMKSPSSNKVFPAELSEVFWNQKKKKFYDYLFKAENKLWRIWDCNGLVMTTVQMMCKIKYKLLIKMEKELIWVKWWKQNRIIIFYKTMLYN